MWIHELWRNQRKWGIYEVRPKTTATKKQLGITTLTNIKQIYVRGLVQNLVRCRECLLFLTTNRKRFYQTLSSVDNSINILLFESSIGSYGKLLLFLRKNYSYGKIILKIILTEDCFVKLWRTFVQKKLCRHSCKKHLVDNE